MALVLAPREIIWRLASGRSGWWQFEADIFNFTRVRTDDRIAGTRETISGFGDLTSRLKINFWGNDGDDSAFGLMPFVKWPTNHPGLGNKSVEGRLTCGLGRNVQLDTGVDLGLTRATDDLAAFTGSCRRF